MALLQNQKRLGGSFTSIRPPYVGFIKNDHARRLALVLSVPVMFFVHFAFLVLLSATFLIRGVYGYVAGIVMIHKNPIWSRPRVDSDPVFVGRANDEYKADLALKLNEVALSLNAIPASNWQDNEQLLDNVVANVKKELLEIESE